MLPEHHAFRGRAPVPAQNPAVIEDHPLHQDPLEFLTQAHGRTLLDRLRLAREEVFGPVLAVMPAHDIEHALEMTNDTDCALTGYVPRCIPP